MSDPMSRPDIEDVLSSIRRLVSEEGREPAKAKTIQPAGAGRLVLTPALRVAESTPPQEAPKETPEVTPGPETAETFDALPEAEPDTAPEAQPDEAFDEITLGDDAEAAAEEVVVPGGLDSDIDPLPEDMMPLSGEGAADEWLPESAPALRAEALAVEAPVDGAGADETGDDGAPRGFGAAPMFMMRPRPATPPPAGPDEIQKTIDTLTSKVAASDEQWDPDVGEDDGDDNHTDAFEGPVRFFHRPPEGRAAPEPESQEPETARLTLRPVAIEEAEEVTPAPAAARRGRDKAAPEEITAEEEAPEAAAPSEEDSAELFDDGAEAILDEDTLREIVREAIREELQGQLGERITRNVRKLVRAEINRAFASRDFE